MLSKFEMRTMLSVFLEYAHMLLKDGVNRLACIAEIRYYVMSIIEVE